VVLLVVTAALGAYCADIDGKDGIAIVATGESAGAEITEMKDE
jgi:hypothetical protein